MKAYLYTQTVCPECTKLGELSLMQRLLMSDGRQFLLCCNPVCDLFHVPFESPTVKIKPVDDMSAEDIGVYLEELRKASLEG